jgi:hypothetical protein
VLCRSACLTSGRRAGDVQPHQKRPGAGGHLGDDRSCTGGSRAGPPGGDLVAVAAVSATQDRADFISRTDQPSRPRIH